ncbi:MAG: glycerophosphodiester phosphodiesterase [Ignavibacteria bacterium]|jgi:glycerophosphoryl diester phosphodiesterase|nr:glycerophosphodiester phosphodiesterase [Ignavibacteria bacterium]
MQPLLDIINTNTTFVAAHRGASGAFKENTLPAFQGAIDIGADFVELDVQWTKDGHILVHHDDRINGCEKLISEMDYSDILRNAPYVPLLSQIFELMNNKCYIIIELKPFFSEQNKQYIDTILQQIVTANCQQSTVIAAMDIETLTYCKLLNPQIHTAAIYTPYIKQLSEVQQISKCDAIICSVSELSDTLCNDANQNGLFIGVYDANSEDDILSCLNYPVKVIGTDFPENAIRIVSNHQINK